MEIIDSMCMSSMYLSGMLNLVTGTEDELKLKRIVDEMLWYPHEDDGIHRKYYGGSRSEGLWLPGSDMDVMLVVKDTIVVSPTSEWLKYYTGHNILIMRNANCRPGHVLLEVKSISNLRNSLFLTAIVDHKGMGVVSSEIYRKKMTVLPGVVEHGPCVSILDNPEIEADFASAFHCPDWPDIARDWVSRRRPHGWPSASTIQSIVKNGCHVVAIGDKTSENASVEWRVSFSRAERTLVHSLNHVQFKVYTLLKLFLKQVINKHDEVRDLISSYFLKTVVFFVAENTPKQFWGNELLFMNFQNCLKMLAQWVREGVCPNYFVPKNNMFLGRVFGKGQQDLIKILDRYLMMGMKMINMCDYFKDLNTTPSMKDLVELELILRDAREVEFRKDGILHCLNTIMYPVDDRNAFRSIRRAMKFLADSETDEESDRRWILLLNTLLGMLSVTQDSRMIKDRDGQEPRTNKVYHVARNMDKPSSNSVVDEKGTKEKNHEFSQDLNRSGNKVKYNAIKRCKYSLSHCTGIDVTRGWLTLATFLYSQGSYTNALQIFRRVEEAFKVHGYVTFRSSTLGKHPDETRDKLYKSKVCKKGYSLIQKMATTLALDVYFSDRIWFCPDEMQLLVDNSLVGFHVPPLPYAAFMIFLCHHNLGDVVMEQQALVDLQAVASHHEQGVHKYPVVYNLIGLCMELTGDKNGALSQYGESLRKQPTHNGANKRLKDLGIEILYHRPLNV